MNEIRCCFCLSTTKVHVLLNFSFSVQASFKIRQRRAVFYLFTHEIFNVYIYYNIVDELINICDVINEIIDETS